MRQLVKIHSAKVERCRAWVNKFSSCGEQTCDHAIIYFKPRSETNGPWSDTKFKPFESTSGINSIWQYRNIPINMEYCEEYLHLTSVKWNHFNGFLFGPCSSIWCIFTVWRVLQIIQPCVIREKTRKENCILNWPRNSHRLTSKPQRQAQWLKIFLVPFNCKFVKNLRLPSKVSILCNISC